MPMAKTWSNCKKGTWLAKEFFDKRGENVFVGGRPLQQYWRVKKFFDKQPDEALDLLHEYLVSVTAISPSMSMNELFQSAKRWSFEQKKTKMTTTHIYDYLKELEDSE